jgi:hypothetical protein
MGEGKTRVILPMLALHWADGSRIVRLNFLPTLLDDAYNHLHRWAADHDYDMTTGPHTLRICVLTSRHDPWHATAPLPERQKLSDLAMCTAGT